MTSPTCFISHYLILIWLVINATNLPKPSLFCCWVISACLPLSQPTSFLLYFLSPVQLRKSGKLALVGSWHLARVNQPHIYLQYVKLLNFKKYIKFPSWACSNLFFEKQRKTLKNLLSGEEKYNKSPKSLLVQILLSKDSKCNYYLKLPRGEEVGIVKIMVKSL